MRHSISPGADTDVSELPELTPQQMKFVDGIVAGLSASDAYRAAYDCSNSVANTVWREASLLKRHPKVSQWLQAAQEAGFMRLSVSREDRIAAEAAFAARAENAGNWGAAGGAHDRVNKLAGLYVERVEIAAGASDAADRLRKLAEQSPDHAALIHKFAADRGIDINKPAETRH